MKKGKLSSWFNKPAHKGIVGAAFGVLTIGAGLALAATGVLAPAGVVIAGFSISGAIHIAAGSLYAANARKKERKGPKL